MYFWEIDMYYRIRGFRDNKCEFNESYHTQGFAENLKRIDEEFEQFKQNYDVMQLERLGGDNWYLVKTFNKGLR